MNYFKILVTTFNCPCTKSVCLKSVSWGTKTTGSSPYCLFGRFRKASVISILPTSPVCSANSLLHSSLPISSNLCSLISLCPLSASPLPDLQHVQYRSRSRRRAGSSICSQPPLRGRSSILEFAMCFLEIINVYVKDRSSVCIQSCALFW